MFLTECNLDHPDLTGSYLYYLHDYENVIILTGWQILYVFILSVLSKIDY